MRSLHGIGTSIQTVTVTTFEAWAGQAQVGRLDLVKLDVEGAELDALRGMAGSLDRLAPRALVVELKDRVLERAGVAGGQVHELLRGLGCEPTGEVLPVANAVFRQRR